MRNIIFLLLILCSSCNKDDKRIILKSTGGFPEIATNLSVFNSIYDDYNSDLEPGVHDAYEFVFSSNRDSKGKDFDIVLYNVNLWYPYDDNILSIAKLGGETNQNYLFKNMVSIINSDKNEFGPFVYNLKINKDDFWGWEYLFFYTQEQDGKLDIKFIINKYVGASDNYFDYEQSKPYDLNIVNTKTNNEGYITISNDIIYYCCDSGGTYDIYEISIDSNRNIINYLTDSLKVIGKPIEIINSSGDDKCPYIVDNFMVFTSNREGGVGGYDLYFSEKKDNHWSKPKNFGTSINSKKDEYRPIIRAYSNIKNDLMIFSSNRDGGLGGFDLYYVGIDEFK